MFGHKTQAEAMVITREMLRDSPVEHGSNYHPWHYETWRFVVEVRAAATSAFRAGVEQKIRIPDFVVPDVGHTVRVEYHETDPDKVELALQGDDRYDVVLSDREAKERRKAGTANRDAAFQAALHATPGTPSVSGPQAADEEAAQDF